MIPAPLPENEKARLAALLRFDVLDTEFEEAYDELTQLAATICGAPISLISLVDSDRQWFKSKVGLGARQTPRDYAFCSHAILQKDVFIIKDTLKDERFFDNPLVSSDPNIRFYAGAPLVTSEGETVGTLCVIDRVPREFGREQAKALAVLAKQVINQLELRLTFKRLQKCAEQLCESNGARDKLYYIIAHDLQTPVGEIVGQAKLLVEELGRDKPEIAKARDTAEGVHASGRSTLELVKNLSKWSTGKSSRIEYRPTVLDLDDLIRQVLTFASVLARGKSIEFDYKEVPGIKVKADRYMIYSVILNLVHNAIKVTPRQGMIRVKLAAGETEVEVSVSDFGAGMPEETRQSLFSLENVIQIVETEGEAESELWPLMCKQFVEVNGGRMEVWSEEGKGSTFRFSLPTMSSGPATPAQTTSVRALETGRAS